MKRVIISGYFDPLHIGHLEYINSAKLLGDYLIVVVNSDAQAILKKGKSFMPEKERCKIVESIKGVDEVVLSADTDRTVCYTLGIIKYAYYEDELIFANGGDRTNKEIPEKKICDKLGIKIVDGVGGGKIQSSSNLIKKSRRKT